MLDNWEKVLITENNAKAELARNLLENHGLQAVVLNKRDSSFQFGLFEVYVPQEVAVQAKQFLNNEISS